MTIANADQRAAWNGDSGTRWAGDAERRDRVLAPVADLLLREADIVPGEAVLDIGCGCGSTTLAAAAAARPDGRVVGIDLSRPMLDVARQRTSTAREEAVEFRHADAQTDDLRGPHDVAISRFGTMFFDDPVAAFANIAGHMCHDGRLCVVTWRPLADNDWLTVPGAALLAYADLPATDDAGPGMFAQSDPDRIADVLRHAGWADIATTAHAVPITVGADLDDAVDYLASSGPGRAMLESVRPEHVNEALTGVRTTLAPYLGTDGVTLEAGVFVTAATVAT